jgi:hypothetical protein
MSRARLTALTVSALLAAMALPALAQSPAPAGKAMPDKKAAAPATPKPCAALKTIDPDNDGKLELSEAKKAAEAAFTKMNKDADKTVDRKELKGRVSRTELRSGDPDKDGTLDLAEYTAMVEKLFAAANKDKDGTLECAELKSSAGRALLKLLN